MADFSNELPGVTFDFKKLSFVIAALCKVLIYMGNHLLKSSAKVLLELFKIFVGAIKEAITLAKLEG